VNSIPAEQAEPLDLGELKAARRLRGRTRRDAEPRDDTLLRAHAAVLVFLVRLEASDAGRESNADVLVPEPWQCRHGDLSSILQPGATALLDLGGRHRQLNLLHASRQEDPAMIAHDLNALPPGVKELANASDDALNLLVEAVHETDAHGWVAGRRGIENLNSWLSTMSARSTMRVRSSSGARSFRPRRPTRLARA
jgi:hypothetical protein